LGKLFKRIAVLVCILSTCIAAATPPQTVKDSMSGNWCVINSQKKFLSGMNIAWLSSNSFGNDVGDTKINMNSFLDKVKKIRKAGGNCMRWWLHTDASHCPKIDATGAVTGLGSKTISNIREALDTAYAYGVVLDLCLFSFDILVPGTGAGKASFSDFNLDNNYKFLTDTSKITTYLNKGLKPILDSVGSHPAILCWEVFNEPEGMLASANWQHVTKKITQNDILRITNRIAGFVHRNSKKMVSTGIASAQYLSEYSDSKLKAAGGDQDGYLDFYMFHYYPEWQDQTMSPFHNPSTTWNMDRPVLIGEFPAKSWSTSITGPSSNSPLKTTKNIVDAFEYAYGNGYAGAMSWAMSEENAFFGDFSTTAPALDTLYRKHKNDIMIKDVTIEEMSGNYVMRADLKSLPIPSGNSNYFELGTTISKSFQGKSNVCFDMYVKPNSGKNLLIQMVIKVGSGYTWSPASNKAFTLNNVEQGVWKTVSIPVSEFGASSVTDIREILFQYYAKDTPYTGTLFFDNIRVDNDTLANFNAEGSAWSTGADSAKISLVKYSDVTSINRNSIRVEAASLAGLPSVTAQGKAITLHLDQASDIKLTITDLRGKAVAKFNCGRLSADDHLFPLGNLSTGHYVANIRMGNIRTSSDVFIK
jgi:hypothetical protein